MGQDAPGGASCPALRSGPSETARPLSSSALLPPLDELVVIDGLALRLLVVELGGRPIRLAEPLGGVHLLVQARAAAAVDVIALVDGLHPRHDLVHLPR